MRVLSTINLVIRIHRSYLIYTHTRHAHLAAVKLSFGHEGQIEQVFETQLAS